MQPLIFGESFSISEFKTKFASADTKIDIVKNPKTDKIFFVCGKVTGRVSNKGYSNNPVITLTTDPETGEIAYMLHNKAMDNVIDSL